MPEKKTETQKAMEKDCIILIAAAIIITYLNPDSNRFSTKCRGPDCAQYNQFTNVCGLR